MYENIDSNIAHEGRLWDLRCYGMARNLFGPRVALELKRAGVFGSALNEGEIAA